MNNAHDFTRGAALTENGNRNANGARVLTLADLQRQVPAAFAIAPHAQLSAKYSMVRTIDVVTALMAAGWTPVRAEQSLARDEGRNGLQRHAIRLRHGELAFRNVGDVVPEVHLVNAHDGTSAYQLHAALFRLACSNGLIVADQTFGAVRLRHVGLESGEVVDASFSIVRELPKLQDAVEGLRQVTLAPAEQRVLAEAAIKLRWDDKATVRPEQVLAPRRDADLADDAFTVMNRIQENVVKGGLRGRTANGQRRLTRGIHSVAEDTKFNKALWHLTEQMKTIKAGK